MFNLTFSTRRRLQRIGIASLVVILLIVAVWACWVIWVGRYVVYSRDGAKIDLKVPLQVSGGQLAVPPSAEETIPLYINEGSDAINTSTDLTQINGYYIDTDTLQNEMALVMETISTLPSGTAVMVELKNEWGTFFYTSALEDATVSTKLDVAAVDNLIKELNSKNLYTIAKIPAFRERNFVLKRNSSFLLNSRRQYGWEDDDKCYWLDPSANGALNWVMSIADELKSLGFDEVVFTEFRIPDTDEIYFAGDKDGAIQNAAASIAKECAVDGFAVSFMTDDPEFPLPEGGQCRLYLSNVSAKDVAATAAKLQVPDQKVNIVFLANTNDTRYDDFSSLRPITMTATGG